jgi:hypothetical protein
MLWWVAHEIDCHFWCGRDSPPQFHHSPLKQVVKDHPDAPKQFGIRISSEVMELVAQIQEHRKFTNQPITLACIVEDALEAYYDLLVERGDIDDKQ